MSHEAGVSQEAKSTVSNSSNVHFINVYDDLPEPRKIVIGLNREHRTHCLCSWTPSRGWRQLNTNHPIHIDEWSSQEIILRKLPESPKMEEEPLPEA